MYTLYYAPGTIALATHIALAEAGAEYTLVRLDFAAQQQRGADYLAVNPKGRVPALATPRGLLTETPALLAYIAQEFPAADLAPLNDAFALAEMQSFNAYLCSTVHVAHAHRMRGLRWADDPAALADMQRKVPENMTACFDLIEHQMLKGPWVMGERYSIADIYLFSLGLWLESDSVDVSRFPRSVVDHRARMRQRPAVIRAEAEQAAGA